jgi:hypothetical protein
MKKKPRAAAKPPEQGFQAPPADGGLSIDRLAQAFAAMMGAADPYAAPAAPADVVKVDASPVLDDDGFAADAADRFRFHAASAASPHPPAASTCTPITITNATAQRGSSCIKAARPSKTNQPKHAADTTITAPTHHSDHIIHRRSRISHP